MAFGIDCTEVTSEALKTPGHIASPVPLIFRYIRVGLTRFNSNPEFDMVVAIHCRVGVWDSRFFINWPRETGPL